MSTKELERAEIAKVRDAVMWAIDGSRFAGWRVCECFFMTLSGKASPTMIEVSKPGFQEAYRATPKEQRKQFWKDWNAKRVADALAICTMLTAKGFKVRRDVGSVFVMIGGAE